MIDDISAKPMQLERLFAPPFMFEQPAYQRPYSWDVSDAERLLDTIVNAFVDPVRGRCFFGTIVLMQRAATMPAANGDIWAGPPRAFDIVDGQQRLVTLTILLAVLRDLLADNGLNLSHAEALHDGGSGAYRLRLRDADGAFLAGFVQAPDACREMPSTDGLSAACSGMLAVREHFIEALIERDGAELAALERFVLARCSVVVIVAQDIDRAFQLFRALNDTGKPLARNDILKAELIGNVPAATAGRYAAFWHDLEARLGDDFEQLFSHIRAMHGRSGDNIVGGIREIAASTGGAEPFIADIMAPAAEIFDQIRCARHDGTPHSADIAQRLVYLGWLGSSEWVAPLMAWWLRHGRNAAALADFLRELERHAYCARILGIGLDKRAQRMSTALAAVHAGTPVFGTAGAVRFSRDEQRNMAFALRDLHTRSQQTCKLVLMRINDTMAGRAQGIAPADFTVEHILPLRPAAQSRWREWFLDTEERHSCAASLGNLTLVSKGVNDAARNLDFDRKSSIYFAPGSAPVAHLTEALRERAVWRADDIRAREGEMFAILGDLWHIGEPAERRETLQALPEPDADARRLADRRGRSRRR